MPTTLLHVFPSFAIGGQQARFATIANRLGRAFRHQLISLDGRDEATSLLNPLVDFELLPQPDRFIGAARRLREIAQTSRKVGADGLITYNWGSIEWAIVNRWYYRRPHIHFEDGFGPDEADRQKPHRVLVRRCALQRSVIVVPSRNLERLARIQWRLKPEMIRYIPNGIDSSRFDGMPAEGGPYFARRADECIIGSFSPLRPEKNIGRLLRAFAEIVAARSAVRLIICGDGPELNHLRELAQNLGVADKAAFVGHVIKPETVMGAFDLFAMTSDTEQMPYAILEAMAAGLPIASTAVGDIPVMVADENRPFIVPGDDSHQLGLALAQLCNDAGLRHRVGEANRKRVEQSYSIEPMVDAFRQTIVEVIGDE
jgi:glycosyltransferase involved in cell wall biosynthesis